MVQTIIVYGFSLLNTYKPSPGILLSALLVLIILLAIVTVKKSEPNDPDEKQDAKNRKVIAKIIDGDVHKPSDLEKESAKNAFATWQAFQKMMFRNAKPVHLKLREDLISKNKWATYVPKWIEEKNPHDFFVTVSNLPVELFLKDAFTEPFPSTHDMDDWAMGNQAVDILILHGIAVNQVKEFFFNKKHHFTNHAMTSAIIQFDVYRIKKNR